MSYKVKVKKKKVADYECPKCGYQDNMGGFCPNCEHTDMEPKYLEKFENLAHYILSMTNSNG